MRKKYKLRHLFIDRADLVDKGANQEAFIELYKRDGSDLTDRLAEIQKHYGPGPHKNGTSQEVHGSPAGVGSGSSGSGPSNAPGTVVSEASGYNPKKKPGGLGKWRDASNRAHEKNLKAAQKLVDSGEFDDIKTAEREIRRRKREGGSSDRWPSSSGMTFGKQVKAASDKALEDRWSSNQNSLVWGSRVESYGRYINENKNIEREMKRRGLPLPGDEFKKHTPGRRRALKALARAKKRNKARMARGLNPIVDGKEVSPSSLSKQSGGPDVDKKKKRPAFMDEGPDDVEGSESEESNESEDEEAKEKRMKKSLMDALEAITKGLIETDVFVESATADDLRDMLPTETLSSIEEVLKSAGSAEPVGEAGMSEPSAISANDLEELVEYVEKLEADVVELEKRLEDPVEETEISKALSELPEDVAKAISAEREALAAAREDLAKADTERADREYIAKMEALPGIVDAPEDFGPVLRKVAEQDADLAKAIEDVLVSANSRIAKGDLFEEVGNAGRGAGGDAMEKATNIAKSMVEATPEMSLEEARSRVWESNPELYAEYNAEREAAK